MRLFVAVRLPGEIRERLALVQDRLRHAQADVSWVRAESLHITLKFLDEVETKRLEPIRHALAEAARGVSPFSMEVAGLGTFGGGTPRVVWVGVREGSAPLAALASRVEDGLGRVGFAKERRGFTAHFTLGRVRSPRNAAALLAVVREETAAPYGRMSVETFSLMQSELNPRGAIHTELDRFSLGTA